MQHFRGSSGVTFHLRKKRESPYSSYSLKEMDLEAEMQSTSDEMSDEDFYDINEDDGSDQQMGSDDDSDKEVEESGGNVLSGASCLPQEDYTILSEDDIRHQQEEAISMITSILSVSRSEGGILLRFFNWNVSKVSEEWYADEQRVRESVGLTHLALHPTAEARRVLGVKDLTCGICFESHSLEKMKADPACGHFFCDTCWIGYIHTAINDGPGCLTLRCPDLSCGGAIGEDMVLALVSPEEGAKYKRYILRTFVEMNLKAKWCPAPGCEYAVEYVVGAGGYDILCKCMHNFCWSCLEEAHRPLDCETVAKWIQKNNSESENMNWILVNSKPCPQCKRPIEKDDGCMHMACTPPCRFEFCWLCLGAWRDHSSSTGGTYECNIYQRSVKEGVINEEERRREMARNSLERFTHYYERWAANESSRKKALFAHFYLQAVQTEELIKKQDQPVSQLGFLSEAWLQIVECRRVLKWTYVYGYYLPESDHRQFFEHVQGAAEAQLERLHMCAETEFRVFLQEESTKTDFYNYLSKLTGLTSVTGKHFESLIKALENGLGRG